jgi:leucyl aminopeptidase
MRRIMTDFSALLQPDQGQDARIIHIIAKDVFEDWLKAQPERARAAVTAARLKAEAGASVILPGDAADAWNALLLVKDADALAVWDLAGLAAKLPAGSYRLEGATPGRAPLGWLLAQHKFTRYKPEKSPEGPRVLLTTEPASITGLVREAGAIALVRDLVDTPAADMGPAELEQQIAALAKAHKGELMVTKGEALEAGYPMIAAVGRAAAKDSAPRLIELSWGDPRHPRIAIVGKGVCFDSGGLDIKPAAGMALMKKDMGGAAHAIGLAKLIMENALPVRLHLLVAAVENSIAGNAMRPGDILTSRKGITVEIDNTDAEGRLVLGDALAKAVEDEASLILDFATLTGAARVALGPDLPALFANNEALAADLLSAGRERGDPLWQLPLWDGYDDMLKSDIADITNSPGGGFAGSITAALFLRRFVPATTPWAHFDTFAWRPSAKPGRPKGGAALGLSASWAMLQRRFGR